MTLVENLQAWKEGVECYNKGDFQCSLNKFREMKDSSAKIAFNIGRAYLSLCDLQAALQAFQEVVRKDEHLAVGHFMLGVVNLMCARHSDALVNFNETFRNLRESKFIDYRQLGLRYKLYRCEVLLNRAVCLSSLGYIDSAVEDLLSGLQCKVEPRHSIIDVSLTNLQNGQSVEFLVMDAIFQPPKTKTANLEKRDYLGKSQVVVDTGTYEMMETPLHLRGRRSTSGSLLPSVDAGELYRVLYDFTAQNVNEVSVKAGDIITVIETDEDGWFTMATNDSRKSGLVPGSYVEKYNNKDEPVSNRQALLTDLRKKETRQSLRRVQVPVIKQPNKPVTPPGERNAGTKDHEPTYVNGLNPFPRKERPKTVDLGGLGRTSSKPPPKLEKTHAGPPKFRRKNSIENLLATKSPNVSPKFGKKTLDFNRTNSRELNNNDDTDDDDGYEKVPEVSEVKPYAIHDVIAPAERERMMVNGRKGPERPAPPPKVVSTMKPRDFPLPTVAPRVPRANTVSALGSAMEQRLGLGSPSSIQKPVKIPPKVPQSPRRSRIDTETAGKEARGQTVALQFVVATSLNVNSSTTLEDIQNAAKEAINRNIASCLWCEKDGKRIRLDDHRASNIFDLVKDGKLNIWCNP